MDDEEILDQLVTMLTGGHETTATTLCWTFHHLLAHPDVLDRLRAELQRAFGDGPVDPVRCAELPWLEACIDDAMRLTPIAIAVTRTLVVDQRFGDHVVKAGTVIWPCTFLAHRRDATWTDPAKFDPERFLGMSTPRPAPTGALLPVRRRSPALPGCRIRTVRDAHRARRDRASLPPARSPGRSTAWDLPRDHDRPLERRARGAGSKRRAARHGRDLRVTPVRAANCPARLMRNDSRSSGRFGIWGQRGTTTGDFQDRALRGLFDDASAVSRA